MKKIGIFYAAKADKTSWYRELGRSSDSRLRPY